MQGWCFPHQHQQEQRQRRQQRQQSLLSSSQTAGQAAPCLEVTSEPGGERVLLPDTERVLGQMGPLLCPQVPWWRHFSHPHTDQERLWGRHDHNREAVAEYSQLHQPARLCIRARLRREPNSAAVSA